MPEPTGPEYEKYLQLIDRAQADGHAVQAAKMFGMPSVKLGGKAVAGFHNGSVVFKLDPADVDGALVTPGAHLFDPMGGRPMKQWVVVPTEQEAAWYGLFLLAIKAAPTS